MEKTTEGIGVVKLRQFLKQNLVRNILALYGVQVGAYLFPLISLPYLARILSPEGWGVVAFAQSFGQYLALLVEYGFNLSATRAVVQHRHDPQGLRKLLAGVLGAKLLLGLLALGLTLLVIAVIPTFQMHPQIAWAATFWALASSLSPLWYFQGLERMAFVATLDLLTRALNLLGFLLFVKGPEDGWKVLVLMGGFALLSSLTALCLAYLEVGWAWPRWDWTREALRSGWHLFLSRGAILYNAGNPFILGLFAPPTFVAYYVGAEKIIRALQGLLWPLIQAIYPRVNHLLVKDPKEATMFIRKSLILVVLASLCLGGSILGLAHPLVSLFLGQEYKPAIPALQILAFLIPIGALSNVFGILWMVPLGLDRYFGVMILGGGLINLLAASFLARFFYHIGMAWSAVIAEGLVALGMYLLLWKKGLDPLAKRRKK